MSDEHDPIVIREYRPGDELGIVACHNEVFDPTSFGAPARTSDHWQWKFRDNPVGQVFHVVAEHESEGIVGLYAAIPYRTWSEGRVQLGSQGVDMMVKPRWRRHGERPGLFTHLGLRFHELYCGRDDGQILYTYGWPMGNWRLGQKYLGYINIRDWDLTFLELAPDRPTRPAPADLETVEVERMSADVDALWDELKDSIGLATIRDSQFYNWRYGARPDHDYRLYECRERSTGRLRGVCVYTVGDFMRPNTGFIVDWLNEGNDVDAMISMISVVEDQAVRDGVDIIASVWNHVDIRFLHLQHAGYKLKGTPYFLVLSSFKYDTHYYRDNWYLTMGDSDLI
ncbi:MAG: hypothetical protein KDB80_02270 [Planctomycetes bacterium]|nr:hypothetical protein [Planctomycetota bacterium]